MAGAYALSTLISDWYDLNVSDSKKKNSIELVLRILFNVRRPDDKRLNGSNK